MARADGTELRTVTSAGDFPINPAWSPRGDLIAYRVEPPEDAPISDRFDGSRYGIWTVRPDGTDTTSLSGRSGVAGGAPAWAPDGSRLAFMGSTAEEPVVGIYVMAADGSDPQRLTSTSVEAQYPAWSPDGSWIAYASVESRQFVLRKMRADGTGDVRLTTGPEDNWPMWSPDGQTIVFSRAGGLALVDADGGEGRSLGLSDDLDAGVPAAWSADGWLAFGCLPTPPTIDLCVARLEDLTVYRILPGFDAGFPAWAPEGWKPE